MSGVLGVDITMKRNRHPADELGDVRAQIKTLQEREEELRRELLDPDADRVGDEWRAEVCHREQERLIYGASLRISDALPWKKFFRPIAFDVVQLKKVRT